MAEAALTSVWKSGLKTAKRPQTGPDWTGKRPDRGPGLLILKNERPEKDRFRWTGLLR